MLYFSGSRFWHGSTAPFTDRCRTLRYAALVGLVAASLCPSTATSQSKAGPDSSGVTAVEYTRLDQLVFDRVSLRSGRPARIAFRLVDVRDLNTGRTRRGVEVEVVTTGRRSGPGALVGTYGSTTYRPLRRAGHAFLRPQALADVASLLERALGEKRQRRKKYKTWTLAVGKTFGLRVRYDPSEPLVRHTGRDPYRRPRWRLLVTVAGTTCALEYRQGRAVGRTFSDWRERLPSSPSE
ncbi:MAG: hypothetical protein ABEL51_01425 [Salinibacter sp.]